MEEKIERSKQLVSDAVKQDLKEHKDKAGQLSEKLSKASASASEKLERQGADHAKLSLDLCGLEKKLADAFEILNQLKMDQSVGPDSGFES